MKASLRQQEEQAAKFKTVGMPVVVIRDNGEHLETRTRSEPWLLGNHSWVVMVEGISGGYSVMRIEPKV